MRKAISIMVLSMLAASCGQPRASSPVEIEDAVVTLPAVPGRPGAAYFTLRSNSGPSRLTGITSPKVGRIELHESMAHGGMMRMEPLAEARFAPDAPLTLAPGGRHAMLFDIDPAVRPGDRLRLDLQLDPAGRLTVDAEVRGPGDVAH